MDSDKAVVRKSFRVPVETGDGISAVINGKAYQVVDMSPGGIRIVCQENSAFTISQTLENCELILPRGSIKNLTARVVHFSDDNKKIWYNGLEWTNLSDQAQNKINEQVLNTKDKLLKPDWISSD